MSASLQRPPVLLAMGDYLGTLAAARSLGRFGVDVAVADHRTLVAARLSRYARRRLTCPDPERHPLDFLGWLLHEGAAHPGQALLATTDDLAWLFARHRGALAQHFQLDTPPLEAIYGLLNKAKLREACDAVGLHCPDTRLYESDEQLRALAPELHFPVVVKPQTQILLWPHQKGRVAADTDTLVRAVHDFLDENHHDALLLADDPQVWRPLLQTYVPASHGVYSLSGFVDASGQHFVTSAARKVFQRPRVLGVGLCFEHAAVNARLAERIHALCRRVGYHGVFEAEFLEAGDEPLLIDFNPRFFGQLAFDVARGVDLPRLSYLAAIGDQATLAAEAARAQAAAREAHPTAYCNRIHLELFLASLALANTHSADGRTWRQWVREHRGALADPLIDRQDLLPAVMVAATSVLQQARHARSTLRQAREH